MVACGCLREANDTDDYTSVTCPINEEFAHIRDHEDVATKGDSVTNK